MHAQSRTAILLTTALTLAVGAALADEIRFQDGSSLIGQIVTVTLQDTSAQVHVIPRDRILLATTSSQPVAIQPATSGGWGARPGVVDPTAGQLPPSGRPLFEMELSYEAPLATPEISTFNDPGEQGEVYIYKPTDARNRAAWVRVGSVQRVENEVIGHLSAEEECQLLHQLVFETQKPREVIAAEVEARRTFTHRMRYVMAEEMNFRPGTWTVYLNFGKLKRHKIWNNVVFNPNSGQKLTYAWSSHLAFGK